MLIIRSRARLRVGGASALRSGPRPPLQPSADPELIAVRIDYDHAAQPLQALIRRLLHRDPFALELGVPGIDVGDVEMDQPTHRAIPGMLGKKKSQPIP
jgi:hypothetical protein